MLLRNSRACALGAALFFSVGLAAQEPQYQSVYQFSGADDATFMTGGLRFGADGRLYGRSQDRTTAWSLRTDGTDFRLLENEEGIAMGYGTLYALNSQGIFVAGTNPNDTDGLPQTNCPYVHYVMPDDGGPGVAHYKYGFVYRFSGDLQPEKLPVSESIPVCPTADLAVDGEDNMYFYSGLDGGDDESARGEKLYRISADGSEMIPLRTFSQPDGNSVDPLSLFFSNDGQWLYGITRWGGEHGNGFWFRMEPDGSDYSEIFQFEDVDETGKGAMSDSPSVIEIGEYFYGGFHDGGANGRGSIFRMKTDGSELRILHDFVYESGDRSNSTGRRPDGPIVLGGDGNIYGTTDQGGHTNSGVIYRIKPAEITDNNNGFEVLYHFTRDPEIDGQSPQGLLAGKDGKLYGAVRNANGGRVYALNIGYVPPGPVITAFTANPTEVEWLGGAGETVMLNWEVENAETCEASGDWSGSKALTGSEQVTPAREGDNVYTLTCDNGSGLEDASSTASVTVRAVAPPPPVAINRFSASPAELTQGDETTLTWEVENAVSCTAGGNWSGQRDTAGGSETLTPGIGSHSYTLTCTGQGGDQQSASAEVSVEALVEVIDAGDGGGSGGGSTTPAMLLAMLALAWGHRRNRAKR